MEKNATIPCKGWGSLLYTDMNKLSRSREKSKVQSSVYDLISFGLKKNMSIYLCKYVISLEGK